MVILKRKNLILGILIFTLTALFLGIISGLYPSEEVFLPTEGRRLIIDAGHGALM